VKVHESLQLLSHGKKENKSYMRQIGIGEKGNRTST